MQINSNTILVKKGSQEFIELENILLKVASANDIKDVAGVEISLSSEEGLVSFKQAGAGLVCDNPIHKGLGNMFSDEEREKIKKIKEEKGLEPSEDKEETEGK
jgi:hypothetical protein